MIYGWDLRNKRHQKRQGTVCPAYHSLSFYFFRSAGSVKNWPPRCLFLKNDTSRTNPLLGVCPG